MDLLVRSPARRVTRARAGVSRLAAPLTSTPSCSDPTRLWWVERLGAHDYLRMVGVAASASAERDPERLVWTAGEDGFELLSRPGAPVRARALDITGLFGPTVDRVVVDAPGRGTLRTLEHAASRAAMTVSSPRLAAACLLPSMRRLPHAVTFADALNTVRRSFVTEELVRPVGADPYVFAAQVLLELSPVLAAAFQPLSGDAVRPAWPIPPAILDSDASTSAHQNLVRRLVEECKRLGYELTSNGHVDARAAIGSRQILFEVKTADADSFVTQVRLAVGQLLDYRQRYGGAARSTALCVVVSDVPAYRAWAKRFLAGVSISAVFASECLDGLAAALAPQRPALRIWVS